MIEEKKYLIGKISSDYETWADIYNYKGILYCVYTETIDNKDHSETSIVIISSKDEGNTWSDEKLLFQKNGVPFWCRPRFLKGKTDQLIIFCNLVEKIEKSGDIYMIEYKDGKWNKPVSTDICGIISGNPMVIQCGKTILSVHTMNSTTKYYQQHIYQSRDMKIWKGISFSKEGYDLCDAQIVEKNNKIITLIREKCISGWDLFIAISDDNGNNWSNLKKVAFKGGSKFSIGIYKDNIYMVFSRDKYLDYRKTLCIVSTNLNLLLDNQNMVEFYALAENGEYKIFGGNNIGYTGIDFIKDYLVTVNVKKNNNNRNTLIEVQMSEVKTLYKSMIRYQIMSFLSR